MKTRSTLFALAAMLVVGFGTQATAQDDAAPLSYTPKHMWEVGFHGGFAFNSGDLNLAPGFGAGIHARRAFDHIFSIRIDGQYFAVNSDAPGSGAGYPFSEFTGSSIGGSAQAVVTLNNFKFDKPVRKFNLYAFAGPGAGLISLKGMPTGGGAEVDLVETANLNSIGFNAVAGGGIALRVSPKFNIGLEHKIIVPFGKSADLFDGFNNTGSTATSFRDIPNYTNLRFNFNIGDPAELAEPLYWVNPLNQVIDELTELKARPVLDLTDTDEDGIIDMLDQETDTPEGAPVDTRGVALDSDGDGVKDFEDAEPYSMPGLTVDSRGVAQAPKYMTQPEIEDLVNGKLAAYQRTEDARGTMEDWFLPMIHFDLNSYTIRKSDYGHLKNIATVLRANPTLRILVSGHTDKLAGDDYNRVLSYNRAKSAKEYLVNRYGISPDRLIIQYNGKQNVLVPTSSGNFMNRRVEFSVAKGGETEMGMPSGPRAGRGTFFSGSRDAGY